MQPSEPLKSHEASSVSDSGTTSLKNAVASQQPPVPSAVPVPSSGLVTSTLPPSSSSLIMPPVHPNAPSSEEKLPVPLISLVRSSSLPLPPTGPGDAKSGDGGPNDDGSRTTSTTAPGIGLRIQPIIPAHHRPVRSVSASFSAGGGAQNALNQPANVAAVATASTMATHPQQERSQHSSAPSSLDGTAATSSQIHNQQKQKSPSIQQQQMATPAKEATPEGGSSISATTSDNGGSEILQKKGRFTLMKASAANSVVGAASTTRNAAGVADDIASARADSGPTEASHQPQNQQPQQQQQQLAPNSAATSTAAASSEPAATTVTRKGRFTLVQEHPPPSSTTANAPPLPQTIVVVDHNWTAAATTTMTSSSHPDRDRVSSLASTITLGSSAGTVQPPQPTVVSAEPLPLAATNTAQAAMGGKPPSAVPTSPPAAPPPGPVVKKMGRFVVSSVGGAVEPLKSPESSAKLQQPQASAVSNGIIATSVGQGVTVAAAAEASTLAGLGDASVPQDATVISNTALTALASQFQSQELHPLRQPVPRASAPAHPQAPNQRLQQNTTTAPVTVGHLPHVATSAPVVQLPAAPVGPPGNLGIETSAYTAPQEPRAPAVALTHVHPDGVSTTSPSITTVPDPIVPVGVPANGTALEHLSAPTTVSNGHHQNVSSSREKFSATQASSASHATTKPGAPGPTRNASVAYTGRQGVGKIFYFVDQLRLEAMDAERTIKSLQTDLRLLKEKNKELEAKARDTERKLNEERNLRETVESKLRIAKKKIRDLSLGSSSTREDNVKSATTSYDSLGIAATLSGEFRDDRTTIEVSVDAHSVVAKDSAVPSSPPFSRTPTRDGGSSRGEGQSPVHNSPTATTSFGTKAAQTALPPTDNGRLSAGNSPRNGQQMRSLTGTNKFPPLPIATAPLGGKPPLATTGPIRDASQAQIFTVLPATGPSRSLANEFDPLRPASRGRLSSGDSVSDFPDIASAFPDDTPTVPSAVHPTSPSRYASKTYHGIRDLHQHFNLQQPALETTPAVASSSSFPDFQQMILVPQQVDLPSATYPTGFSYQNGNHQWTSVTGHDKASLLATDRTSFPADPHRVPTPDPFDEIMRRSSNAG